MASNDVTSLEKGNEFFLFCEKFAKHKDGSIKNGDTVKIADKKHEGIKCSVCTLEHTGEYKHIFVFGSFHWFFKFSLTNSQNNQIIF